MGEKNSRDNEYLTKIRIMKKLITSSLFIFTLLFNSTAFAELSENDPYLAKQKEECAKRSNKTWDTERNRCIEKVENKEMRIAEKDAGDKCLAITDLSARKQCFIDHARTKANGMNTEHKASGLKNMESMINHAYTVLAAIQMAVGSGSSNCTSRTIFGATSLVGSLSDIYLKVQAKKKMKELQDKYKIDTSTGRHDAQVKALEYLKEEQDTLADLASKEQKRHMIMMAGFGVALGFTLYEGWSTPACTGEPGTDKVAPEEKKLFSGDPMENKA